MIEIPLLAKLRAAAAVERDELVRFKMNDAAIRLSSALTQLAIEPTGGNLTAVNGLWASGVRALGMASPVAV